MARIFISYSRTDESFAYQLATYLEEVGAEVWIDQTHIRAGKNWSNAIQQGLDDADVMLVVLSPDSMASVNVTNEWQYFFDNGKTIIPVLWQPTKVHFQLHRLQYVDFHSQPFDAAMDQLTIELTNRSGEVSRIAPMKTTNLQTLPPKGMRPVPSTETAKPKRGKRSMVGLFGMIALVILPIVGIGAVGANLLMNRAPAMPTPDPIATTPAPIHTATAAATPDTSIPLDAQCPVDFAGYLEPRLETGTYNARIKETGGANRLRAEPHTSGAFVTMLEEGHVLEEVIAGPACAEGYVWWRIRSGDDTGWTAESSFEENTYYIEPFPPTRDLGLSNPVAVPTETPSRFGFTGPLPTMTSAQ
ncbi:toll/interleukin-1 receptor domain-containing protein [Phototrophicus methaneseepsis]|uniref:Toll/interleukin-1 receptor domain-containing protein n=1 Tax=Phototrophicus methaneseepsis TaxID=2710758 RepID=A0A7S8EAS5_9CHLR|nr:TIR domain-containing protein [Phototrophicus methaneseepsis]QPC83499.1 toll/interleukin-1 receptor domain-containing protein [Phototrophicus methaneseepsis]